MPNNQYDVVENLHVQDLNAILTPNKQRSNPSVAAEAINNHDLQLLYRIARIFRHVTLHADAPAEAHTELADALNLAVAIRGRNARALQVKREASSAEEQVPIFSRIHAFGNVDDLPAIRDYKIDNFFGEPKDKLDCLAFIKQILRECENRNLSEAACIRMFGRHCRGSAESLIEFSIADGDDLENLIRRMEIQFAGLKQPELARARCEKITRNPGETLASLGLRVRLAARMAGRNNQGMVIPGEETRIAMRVFRMGLSTQVQTQMDTLETHRRSNGLPDMTYDNFVAKAHDMESRNELYENRPVNKQMEAAKNGSKTSGTIMMAEAQNTVQFEDDKAPSSVPDPGTNMVLALYMQQFQKLEKEKEEYKKKYDNLDRRNRDRSSSRSRSYERGRSHSRNRSDSQSRGKRSNSSQKRQQSPHPKKWTLPAEVNCHQGECVKCGKVGHFAKETEKCYLGHIPLVPIACPKCKKGGHLPEHCPIHEHSKN